MDKSALLWPQWAPFALLSGRGGDLLDLMCRFNSSQISSGQLDFHKISPPEKNPPLFPYTISFTVPLSSLCPKKSPKLFFNNYNCSKVSKQSEI